VAVKQILKHFDTKSLNLSGSLCMVASPSSNIASSFSPTTAPSIPIWRMILLLSSTKSK